FLKFKPIKNLLLIGLMEGSGLEVPLQEGRFYGVWRGASLVGVAFVGRQILLAGSVKAALSLLPIIKQETTIVPRAGSGEKVVVEPFCEALEREYPRLVRMARNEDQVMLALRQLKIQPNAPGQVHHARLEDLEEVADA